MVYHCLGHVREVVRLTSNHSWVHLRQCENENADGTEPPPRTHAPDRSRSLGWPVATGAAKSWRRQEDTCRSLRSMGERLLSLRLCLLLLEGTLELASAAQADDGAEDGETPKPDGRIQH